jgi:hypothetical protein
MVRRLLLGHCLALAILAVVAQSSPGGDVPSAIRADLDHLRVFVQRDPEKDARSAIANGRLRFLGVAGYVVEVPGVDGPKTIGCVAALEKVDIIRGTSDVVYGDEHAALIKEARRYAARYNAIIAKHRDFRPPPSCLTGRGDR